MYIIITEDYEAMSRGAPRLIAEAIRRKPDASLVIAAGNSGIVQDFASCLFRFPYL